MISSVGTDIVEIDKIRQYASKRFFLDRIFTRNEIKYAESKGIRKAEHLATTFAAKEAVFKALGAGWLEPQEIEILRDRKGKPLVVLSGKLKEKLSNSKIIASLSYNKNHAIAFVIINR